MIYVPEALPLPGTAGTPRQVFWWLSSLGAWWVPSPLVAAWFVPAGATQLCGGPQLFSSTPLVESIPLLFPADSPTHQFEFHFGNSGEENKDSCLPQKPSAFPAAQAPPPGPARGVSTCPAASLQQTQAQAVTQGCSKTGSCLSVTSPAHVCSGAASSAVALLAQKLLLAMWLQPGILARLRMVLKEDMGNVAHLLGNTSRTLHERH